MFGRLSDDLGIRAFTDADSELLFLDERMSRMSSIALNDPVSALGQLKLAGNVDSPGVHLF